MAIYQVSSYNNNSVLNKIPLKNGYIYHMTHIEHLPSILAHGLLSHNNPYKKHDISNKSANDKRERIEPIHNRSVHEYVPFYFNPRNAMLYRVQKEQGDNIVLLEIKKEILLLNGVIFTNGNAAAQSLGFADDIDDLLNPSFINWDEVFATSWNDANENVKNEKKFKMMAEVLVPDMVPSAMIAGIVCQNSSVCQKVAKLLNNSINISWSSSLFFNVSSDTTANQKREFKYYPQTKDELKALVKNEDIYLGDIDTSAITDMSSLFFKGYNIMINERENFDGIEFWNVSNVTNMSSMFSRCKNFNQPLNSWDVSNVTNMSFMFKNCENFNQPLNSWDVSNVSNMNYMFCGCTNFNQPLNSWNVSNVTDMSRMFGYCTNFNQPLNSWDVSNVTDMSYMFKNCENFNQPLNSWNVSNVTNMYHMFYECRKFNQPLNSWNVSNVTDMSYMFYRCKNFNQPLNSWNVSNVTNMIGMFAYCENFNQPLNSWNVSNVTNMNIMFENCEIFNQPLNSWDVSNVTDMSEMFRGCANFNQSLKSWNICKLKFITDMFKNTKTSFKNAININEYYKYHPKTKNELKTLVDDKSIYLGYIDTSAITDMSKLFYVGYDKYHKKIIINKRENFDGIELWNVSNVTDMSGMFSGCKNFNQPLNSWDVSNVTDMRFMFVGCKNFNQPLNSWNVSNVTNMICMFSECVNFNQPLNSWNVSNVADMRFMFVGCHIDKKNLPNFTQEQKDKTLF